MAKARSYNRKIVVAGEDFEDAVKELLDDYVEQVGEDVISTLTEVATETVRELEATSPSSDRPRKKGRKYKTGWFIKSREYANRYHAMLEIGNKQYQLTHLLEHGHIKVVHGKVLGTTAPRPHIAKAEQNAIKKLNEGIERSAKQ